MPDKREQMPKVHRIACWVVLFPLCIHFCRMFYFELCKPTIPYREHTLISKTNIQTLLQYHWKINNLTSPPPKGHTYVNKEGSCCGRCLKTLCDQESYGSRGDEDVQWHEVSHCSKRWIPWFLLFLLVLEAHSLFSHPLGVQCTKIPPSLKKNMWLG